MGNRREKKLPAYQRLQGNRDVNVGKKRFITFSLCHHIKGEGQTIEEWNKLGLHGKLLERIKHICQYPTHIVRQNQWVKEYTKVNFPEHSKFKVPHHVTGVTWAVMHISKNSKEVVVGFIEDDVFYIVFLDKNHEFWPTNQK
jgi:hypothetical protein